MTYRDWRGKEDDSIYCCDHAPYCRCWRCSIPGQREKDRRLKTWNESLLKKMIDEALGKNKKRKHKAYSNHNKRKAIFALVFIGCVGLWVALNFTAIMSYVQPVSSYMQQMQNDMVNQRQQTTAPIQSSPRIVATVPPVIQKVEPIIPTQVNLSNPSWSQLKAFLLADKTDELPYIYPSFVCDDFAKMLQDNAKKAGWRCAVVSLDMAEYNDPYKLGIASNAGHACNAFQTTDKGLVYIDCTGTPFGKGPTNKDKIVDVVVGGRYIPVSIFVEKPTVTMQDNTIVTSVWADKWDDAGLVVGIRSIRW